MRTGCSTSSAYQSDLPLDLITALVIKFTRFPRSIDLRAIKKKLSDKRVS